MRALLILILVAGCAAEKPTYWQRDGATQNDYNMDNGQCQAQAFAVPNAPVMQMAFVHNSCMRGKGWTLRQ